MPHRRRDLTGLVVPTNPPLAPLTGGKPGKADRVASIFAEQDRVLGSGRRIVGQVGLHGADGFHVASTNPTSMSQTYPDATTARVAFRGRFALTPGCFLRAVAIVIPSGETQRSAALGFVSAGSGGSIVVTATFNKSGGSEIVTAVLDTPVSSNPYHGESTTAGAAWAEAHRLMSGLIKPDLPDAATAANWSDGVTVDLTIAFKGGTRCISCVVFEEPYQYVRSFADTDWASSIWTTGAGKPLPAYPTKWPVDKTNLGGDPSGGTDYLIATAARQTRTLGPMLIAATTWNEASQAVTSNETDEKTTTSTSLIDLWRPAITAWATNIAGWSVSSGGNAPAFNTAGPHLELRDKARVVPVRVRIYCKKSGTGNGFMRVVTAAYSLVNLTVTSTSWGWVEATFHPKCSFGPEDASTLVVLGSVTAGSTMLHVRYLQLEFVDR